MLAVACSAIFLAAAHATTYEVGPGQHYPTIANVPKLVAAGGDPWRNGGWVPHRLEGALAKARELW